jgi:hypothetical protein
MTNDIDYVGIFRQFTGTQLAESLSRLQAEFADPYTAISSSGSSSQRDREQIARELAACSAVIRERSETTPRNRARASFSSR